MSARVVVIGYKGIGAPPDMIPGFGIHAIDAAALVESGCCRVAIAEYAGALSDATVLVLTDSYREAKERLAKAWGDLVGMLFIRHLEDFVIPSPIPLTGNKPDRIRGNGHVSSDMIFCSRCGMHVTEWATVTCMPKSVEVRA